MGIAVGDKIIYGKYNGVEIKVGGEKVIIMKESDVFGILRNE
jgi:chaperonin GroES